jgi:hypothetical protein
MGASVRPRSVSHRPRDRSQRPRRTHRRRLAPAFIGLGDFPRDVFVPATPLVDRRIGRAPARSRETEITVRLRPGVTAVQARPSSRVHERDHRKADRRASRSPSAGVAEPVHHRSGWSCSRRCSSRSGWCSSPPARTFRT